MVAMDVALFLAGLFALLVGGDALVRGAASLARSLGISSLVVGLTVVSFGTSAPELAVSLTSATSDSAPLALGNVVGSNIFNVLLVLGLAATFRPLVVRRQLIHFDMPVMASTCVLLVILSVGGVIGGLAGLLMCALLATYLWWTVRVATKERDADREDVEPGSDIAQEEEDEDEGGPSAIALVMIGGSVLLLATAMSVGRYPSMQSGLLMAAMFGIIVLTAVAARGVNHAFLDLGITAAGIATILLSADCLVEGAVGMARYMGVSDAVIGLTVVAAGTSLPEAVTSMLASAKGESDLAIGNVVGSNIFNVLCIVGLTAVVMPLPVAPELMRFDYAVMVGVAVGLWWLVWLRKKLRRIDGVVMLGCFVAYLAVQVLRVI
jgi:cation:H+ antiporter